MSQKPEQLSAVPTQNQIDARDWVTGIGEHLMTSPSRRKFNKDADGKIIYEKMPASLEDDLDTALAVLQALRQEAGGRWR